MDTVEVLSGARKLVAEQWKQYSATNRYALGYCAVTAIHYHRCCDYGETKDASEPCAIFAKANGLDVDGVAAWNDAPERTQLEVIAAFDKAIALAEGRRE